MSISIRATSNLDNFSSADWSIQAKRRAASAGAMAAISCMQERAPVRTGKLRASWHYTSQRENPVMPPKGYRINRLRFRIFLENTAVEFRKSGPKYYMPYPELGFYHVWQRKYHPGRYDTKEAAYRAALAIREVLVSEFKLEAGK